MALKVRCTVRPLRSSSGMGMLEVVMAAGIMIVVLLGASSMVMHAENGAQSVQKRLDAGQLGSFINSILNNGTACAASGLVGTAAPAAKLPTTPDTVSVPTLNFAGLSFDDSGGPNSLFDNGQVKVINLKYHAAAVLGSVETVVIRLQVSAQGAGNQAVVGGNTLAPVDFPATFNVLAG